ncbi:MAG: hypothetical protein A2Y41_12975 [Spirochaetes bacterium GWB1_36_13]|nr:MAG: hypothetical protein A2Y41_12975 [Spirochaetes bacterium GWB1_36_13]
MPKDDWCKIPPAEELEDDCEMAINGYKPSVTNQNLCEGISVKINSIANSTVTSGVSTDYNNSGSSCSFEIEPGYWSYLGKPGRNDKYRNDVLSETPDTDVYPLRFAEITFKVLPKDVEKYQDSYTSVLVKYAISETDDNNNAANNQVYIYSQKYFDSSLFKWKEPNTNAPSQSPYNKGINDWDYKITDAELKKRMTAYISEWLVSISYSEPSRGYETATESTPEEKIIPRFLGVLVDPDPSKTASIVNFNTSLENMRTQQYFKYNEIISKKADNTYETKILYLPPNISGVYRIVAEIYVTTGTSAQEFLVKRKSILVDVKLNGLAEVPLKKDYSFSDPDLPPYYLIAGYRGFEYQNGRTDLIHTKNNYLLFTVSNAFVFAIQQFRQELNLAAESGYDVEPVGILITEMNLPWGGRFWIGDKKTTPADEFYIRIKGDGTLVKIKYSENTYGMYARLHTTHDDGRQIDISTRLIKRISESSKNLYFINFDDIATKTARTDGGYNVSNITGYYDYYNVLKRKLESSGFRVYIHNPGPHFHIEYSR